MSIIAIVFYALAGAALLGPGAFAAALYVLDAIETIRSAR